MLGCVPRVAKYHFCDILVIKRALVNVSHKRKSDPWYGPLFLSVECLLLTYLAIASAVTDQHLERF